MTHSTTRDELAVYGTDGEMYYPDPVGGAGHPDVSTWFLSSGLRCYLDTGEASVMTYLGDVRHPREKDQAFAVYRGDDPSSPLDACRERIRDRLVDGEGWQIVEVASPSNQKSLYRELMGEGAADNRERVQTLARHTEFESELLRRALRVSNARTAAEPVEVVASDYRVAAALVYGYSDVSPVRIHLYDNQQATPPADVDLAIAVEPGPYTVRVPSATRELLESLRQRLDEHRARERKRATIEAIGAHARHDDRPAFVREAVDEGFDEHYGALEVVETETRERLESERRTAERERERLRRELTEARSALEFQRAENARLGKYVRTVAAVEKTRNVVGTVRRLVGLGGPDRSALSADQHQGSGLGDGHELALSDEGSARDRHSGATSSVTSLMGEGPSDGRRESDDGLPWVTLLLGGLLLALGALTVAWVVSGGASQLAERLPELSTSLSTPLLTLGALPSAAGRRLPATPRMEQAREGDRCR